MHIILIVLHLFFAIKINVLFKVNCKFCTDCSTVQWPENGSKVFVFTPTALHVVMSADFGIPSQNLPLFLALRSWLIVLARASQSRTACAAATFRNFEGRGMIFHGLRNKMLCRSKAFFSFIHLLGICQSHPPPFSLDIIRI